MRLLFCLLVMPCSLLAQSTVTTGIYFSKLSPSADFSDNITRDPIGGSFIILFNPNGSAFQYGAELGMNLHSGKKYFYQTNDEGVPNNIDYLYEENGFFYYHMVGRYLLMDKKIVSPYVTGRVGVSSFFSAIRSMEVSEVFEDRFQFDDHLLSAAVGGGASLDISKILGKQWSRALLFDISLDYYFGGEATYRNSVKRVLVTSFEQSYRTSTTSAMQLKTGLLLKF